MVNLFSQGLISKRTVLDELQRGGVLDPDLKVEDEIERTDDDRKQEMEKTLAEEQKMTEVRGESTQEKGESRPEGDSEEGKPKLEDETPEKSQSSAKRAQ